MKTVRLSLVIALAALCLQACDVGSNPPQPKAAASQPAQSAAPVDPTPTPVQSSAAPAAAPETHAMGAQPGAAPVPESDGVAAQSELARFFEQNPIKPPAKSDQKAS